MSKNKIAEVVALFLLFAMVVSSLNLSTANAQLSKATYAIIGAVPNPVGVGQETLILTGITDATVHPQEGWEGITVTVTKPDGTTQTLGPLMTDTTGMTGTIFVPSVAGNYTLVTNFPEQELWAGDPARPWPAGTIFKASKSAPYTLVVTEEPRQLYPGFPLPTEYWTRPIDAQIREWTSIAGNWLNVVNYNRLPPEGNDDSPDTAHLLWAMQLAEGGLVGEVDNNAENIDAISYEHGDAYEGKWSNPVIMNGVLFFVRQASQSRVGAWSDITDTVEQTTVAVDLHTGEVLWEKVLGDNERQAFGQIFYWKTMNMYGAFSYLWTTVGTTMNAYDPFTGRWEYTITNVPRGTRTVGPNGEILIYVLDQRNGWMTQWNSTSVVYKTYLQEYLSGNANSNANAYYWAERWRPHGITFDSNAPFNVTLDWSAGIDASATTVGIDWNVTIPTDLPGTVQDVVGLDRILGGNTNWAGGNVELNPVFWAISIKDGQRGNLLFKTSWSLPYPDVHVDVPGSFPASLEDGIFVVASKETRTYFGLSLDTGKQVWGPTSWEEPYLNAFTILYMQPWGQSVIRYGKLYTAGMGGVVNCYDVSNGNHLWTYAMTDPYTEQLFSQEWPAPVHFVVDGKVFLFQQEHSANTPLPRGAPAICLNATTGEEIWRINGLRLGTRWGGQPIIGDSIIAGFSSYNNRVVAIGKGPSATTVTAGPEVSVHGSSVLVKGMVTDISPGTKDAGLEMRFPHGVPAVSDADMSDWMLYVYSQFTRPTDITGVEVVVSVLDPNNNAYEVGRATSDASGFYKVAFTPEVPGEYTIIASFDGSKSYYGSFAETAINVEEAPAATPGPTPTPAPMTDTYVLGIGAGAIIAIVIIGLILILMMRKR